ncbi:hypothetical protein [Streptococcus australis]|uniref:hypothetical protein n=1 Tax=Streptococcus australis TaxID=113107 RepID=UPI0039C33BA1
MKQQHEFYAIANKETNQFLVKYKSKERALTFSASYADDIRFASIFEKKDDETSKSIENIAKAVGGRLVKIKAEYEITEEDGTDLEEPSEDEKEDAKARKILSD